MYEWWKNKILRGDHDVGYPIEKSKLIIGNAGDDCAYSNRSWWLGCGALIVMTLSALAGIYLILRYL